MRVIITGGHLTPALALAQYLIQKQHQVFFLGRQYSSQRFKTLSHESEEAKKIGVTFYAVPDWKIDRSSLKYTLATSPQFIHALIVTFKLMTQIKPDLVVVFGSSMSVPVGLSAKLKRLPLVLHEQTFVPGLASRFIGSLADLVALGFEATKKYFPQAVFTGNLLRAEFYKDYKDHKPPLWYHNSKKLPLLLVLGGNQGSQVINQNLQVLYEALSQRYFVVHQCGQGQGSPRETELKQTIGNLPLNQRAHIVVKPWLTASEIAYLMHQADCVVSRSGANTTAEIIQTQTPAIVIPFAHSAYGEQNSQAEFLESQGLGLILTEASLTPTLLLKKIHQQIKLNPTQFRSQPLSPTSISATSLDRFYQLLLALKVK